MRPRNVIRWRKRCNIPGYLSNDGRAGSPRPFFVPGPMEPGKFLKMPPTWPKRLHMKDNLKKLFYAAIVATCFSACQGKNDYDKLFKNPKLYCDAVHELNTVVMGNNFGPIVASRNYLYAAVAGYEVIAAGYPDKSNSLAGQLRDLKPLPKPIAGQKVDFELASL